MQSSAKSSSAATDGQKGVYKPAPAGAFRTPCPVLNALANHGHIPRDGRNMTADQLKAAFRYLGFGIDTTSFLVNGAFKVHADNPTAGSGGSRLGLRDADEVDPNGVPVLNLDKIGRSHAVEHDVSITRQDRTLGDCTVLQPQLLADFLKCPADGCGFTGVFGKGMYYTIPKEYVKAMFEDERLPFEEGWTPRKTPFMFPELWALLKLISNRAWPF